MFLTDKFADAGWILEELKIKGGKRKALAAVKWLLLAKSVFLGFVYCLSLLFQTHKLGLLVPGKVTHSEELEHCIVQDYC